MTAPSGWLSDPNGLFCLNGRWHLHYQYQWPRQWGHATSGDLIRWTTEPVSLVPDALGDCWSGCAVMDTANTSGLFPRGGGPVIVYTAQDPTQGQRIALAFSEDSARTWRRYPGNPVLSGSTKDFRDPCVLWDEKSRRWVMVLSEATRLTFFCSPNLRDWTETGRLNAARETEDAAVECPGLYEVQVEGTSATKWVLAYSNVSQRMWGPKPEFGPCAQRYYVGSFDGGAFHAEEGPFPLGGGPDMYASIAWNRDPEGARRTVLVGWLNHWGYAGELPTAPWQGCLTIPRELSLRRGAAGLRLVQRPVREVYGHMGRDPGEHRGLALASGNSLGLGRSLCGIARMRFRPAPGARVELSVFGNGQAGTIVGYDAGRGTLYLDRRHSGSAFSNPHFAKLYNAALPLPASGVLELSVLYDHSTVEVFADDGSLVLSAVVLPDAGSDLISVRSLLGTTQFEQLETFHFKG